MRNLHDLSIIPAMSIRPGRSPSPYPQELPYRTLLSNELNTKGKVNTYKKVEGTAWNAVHKVGRCMFVVEENIGEKEVFKGYQKPDDCRSYAPSPPPSVHVVSLGSWLDSPYLPL
jgi:hypothetical protein